MLTPPDDLPYVTPPAPVRVRRIGNARCGVLEVEERGGISTDEDGLIARLTGEGESAFVEGAKAAEAIAAAESARLDAEADPQQGSDPAPRESVSIVEAFEIIRKAIGGQDLEPAADAIRLRHAELVHRVAQVFARTGQTTMEASVTALIRCRLNRPNWTMEQTRKMPRVLFRGLHQLVLDEQAAEAMPEQPVTEEEVGKRRAGSGNRRRRTGPKSSGSSAPASPASSTDAATAES